MKQHFPIILVILSLLVALVGVAAAPMATGTVTLISVEYVPNKGPVFTFEVSGKFSKSALKGMVYVQGAGNYPLYCTKVNETTIKCNTSQKVSDVNVSLTWGGFKFWAYVPPAPASTPAPSCYSFYDWDTEDPWATWKPYGISCPDIQPKYGDVVNWYNPIYEENYDYEFMPQGPSCSGINEDAYYYQECPGTGT